MKEILVHEGGDWEGPPDMGTLNWPNWRSRKRRVRRNLWGRSRP